MSRAEGSAKLAAIVVDLVGDDADGAAVGEIGLCLIEIERAGAVDGALVRQLLCNGQFQVAAGADGGDKIILQGLGIERQVAIAGNRTAIEQSTGERYGTAVLDAD